MGGFRLHPPCPGLADAQPVFDKILVSCKHLFGGDELDVLLVDEQGQLNIAAYIGDFHDVVAATFPAPVERTPAGRAIRERRVMHWPDLVGGEDVPGVLRKMAKLIGYRPMVFGPCFGKAAASVPSVWRAQRAHSSPRNSR